MKFKVSGSNRDTGARMQMEFEAESKGAAERKAAQAGMTVHHVEDISDGYGTHATEPRQHRPQGRGARMRTIILLAVVVLLVWFFWNHLRGLIPGL